MRLAVQRASRISEYGFHSQLVRPTVGLSPRLLCLGSDRPHRRHPQLWYGEPPRHTVVTAVSILAHSPKAPPSPTPSLQEGLSRPLTGFSSPPPICSSPAFRPPLRGHGTAPPVRSGRVTRRRAAVASCHLGTGPLGQARALCGDAHGSNRPLRSCGLHRLAQREASPAPCRSRPPQLVGSEAERLSYSKYRF
jgi:hypothetical protein